MKNYVCLLAAIFVWCFMLPIIIAPTSDSSAAATLEQTELSSSGAKDVIVTYKDTKTGSIKEMPLEQYTALALSALMDATVHEEALKAAAVTIRSVVCYRAETGEHGDHLLCDSADHCFALAEKASKESEKATSATRGIMLTYNDKAVLALSHSSSRNCTESYKAVSGTELSYLSSVPVYDESGFTCYKTELFVTDQQFKNAFYSYKTDFNTEKAGWIGETERTAGGRIYTVMIGGLRFKGTTVMGLFNLPSTDYEISQTQDGFVFSCYGEGNGVGMSRCTAILMAKEGKTYREILEYFYKDANFSEIQNV